MARSSPPLASRSALPVVLLIGWTLGCGGNGSLPAVAPTQQENPDTRQEPADSKQGPKLRAGKPAEMILGKWENAEREIGLEFCANGIVKLSRARRFPSAGVYKLLDDKTLELKFPEDEKPVPFRFATSLPTMTLTSMDKDAIGIAYKAVDVYSKELNNPNHQPNEQQRRWIVGSWRGVEKEFGQEDVYLYAFYPDGTFSDLRSTGIAHQASFEMGTYRLHPDADNFLELTYPDTGKMETVYAEIGEKELALTAFWGLGKELRKHERVEDKEERTKPVRADVLTAFALFRECAADPDKSKEKYTGKTLELTGSVGGHLSVAGKSEISLITGKGAHVKCVLDTTDKATADALRPIHLGALTGGGMNFVTLSGQFESLVKEEDKGAKVIAGVLGGEPVEKGPQLFVRLSGCKIVSRSELKVK